MRWLRNLRIRKQEALMQSDCYETTAATDVQEGLSPFWQRARAAHRQKKAEIRANFDEVKRQAVARFALDFPDLPCAPAPENWPLVQFDFEGYNILAEYSSDGVWVLSYGKYPDGREGIVFMRNGGIGELYRECHRLVHGETQETEMVG